MLIRLGVHYIVTDMNVAYYSLIKECFPNTKRFHIVQHLNRAFDGVCKQIMK
ncbi:transposase [Ligilactobacillus sp. Marseille-Q7487]|uniref:transposase n=1 Tax=Ligilactobacillus sp. Marseille-Q7487 TaxID=3022128 RepID=UPI0024A7BA8E|nr:transposase [Ligilactobacillus sp. Marseille-Q7487]